MWKRVILTTAAIAIVGSTIVYAQRFGGPGGPAGGGPMRGLGRLQLSPDDISAFVDARVAAMKAGLRLNADQEKNWTAYEEAYRNLAKLRTDRLTAMREGNQPPAGDIMERLQRRAEAMGQSAAAVKQISDATVPLYRSLDDGQKRRFAMLSRMLRPQMRGMHHRGSGPRGGPGEMRRGGFGSGPIQRGGMEGRGGASGAGPMERIRFTNEASDRSFESYGAETRSTQ